MTKHPAAGLTPDATTDASLDPTPVPAITADRMWRLLLGLTLCGLGIAAMVAAELGLGPWDVLHQGISRLTPIPIGTVGIFVGLIVLLGWIPLHERPGTGTVLNVVVIGVVIDVTLLFLPVPEAVWVRIAYLLSGPLLFAIGSGWYIGAGLGAGPRDGLMTGISRVTGWPVGRVRTGIEVTVLGVGFLLGGTAGIGTILFTFTIGPLVALTLPRLAIDDAYAHRRAMRSPR